MEAVYSDGSTLAVMGSRTWVAISGSGSQLCVSFHKQTTAQNAQNAVEVAFSKPKGEKKENSKHVTAFVSIRTE